LSWFFSSVSLYVANDCKLGARAIADWRSRESIVASIGLRCFGRGKEEQGPVGPLSLVFSDHDKSRDQQHVLKRNSSVACRASCCTKTKTAIKNSDKIIQSESNAPRETPLLIAYSDIMLT
jgi:hydroxyacyl-ACP dehydratase HTD2-like protein with hotdog domain